MRGFRLNGWQRIGIILSVIWLVVGPIVALKTLYDPIYAEFLRCFELMGGSPGGGIHCEQIRDEALAYADTQKTSKILIVALAPIPIVWLLIYGVIGLVRWIRRGFQPST